MLLCGCADLLGLEDDQRFEDPSPAPAVCAAGEVRSCYGGPAATDGIGACRAGQERCRDDGRGWGPCEGEVQPVAERCGDAVDDDCDGVASCGETQWAASFGADQSEIANTITAGPDGAIVAAGFYRSSAITFGGALLPGAPSINGWIAAFDASGVHRWTRGLWGDGALSVRDVAVDQNGDTVLVASIGGSVSGIDLTPIDSAGGLDVLVAKLDAAGNTLWVRRWGDGSDQVARAIAVDASGNVVIAGDFRGTLDFASGALASVDLSDGFVASLASDGSERWAVSWPGTLDQVAYGLAVDGAGAVAVSGQMFGRVDFGGGELEDAGDGDVFLVQLEPDGSHRWSQRFGDEERQECRALAATADGEIVLGAFGRGSVRFDLDTLSADGGDDLFVARFDRDGHVLSEARFGDGSIARLYSLALDGAGRVAMTGFYEGAIDFGGGPLPETGLREPYVFVTKHGRDGQHLFSRGIAVAGNQDTGSIERAWRAIAFDPEGAIVLAGYFSGAFDLGGGALPTFGGTDVFVSKLAP